MPEQTTKPCRMCHERIANEALKCPHCHHMQGAMAAFLYNPAAQVFLAIGVPAIIFVIFAIVMSLSANQKKQEFSQHASQIKIVDTRTAFGTNRDGPVVTVIGQIANDTGITWSRPLLSIVLKDAQGKIVGAKQASGPTRLPKNQKTPFSIPVEQLFPASDYRSHEVEILSATEAGASFLD